MSENESLWGGPTRWSRILANPRAEDTWRHLVDRYRGPILAWILRRLRGNDRAEEVAADFFGYLYEKDLLSRADPSRGKFRAFIQGVLRYYLSELARGERRHDLVDRDVAHLAVSSSSAIEEDEERLWARRILRNACKELATTHPRNADLLQRYYGLSPHERATADQLCTEHGLSKNALSKALHDARKELLRLIREEVRETVADATAFEEEWSLVRSRLLQTNGSLLRSVEEDAG